MQLLEPGAVAIVTGAAGGIGLAMVAAIAAEGVSVACVDRVGADLSKAVRVCADAGTRTLGIEADVREREAMRRAAGHAASLGAVRYGVNCAGVDKLQPTVDMPTADWNRVLEVNLTGVLFSCLASTR